MYKMIELRTEIQSLLETLHSRVYFNSAPDSAVFPYVVFDIPNSITDGTLETFVLDIDVWGNDSDTTGIETLIGNIDNALHKKTILITDTLCFALYRENRLVIRDDEAVLTRRKYVYQARVFEKYY